MPLNASHYILHRKRSRSDCLLANDVLYTMAYTLCDQPHSVIVWMNIWANDRIYAQQSHITFIGSLDRIVCVKSMCGVCHMNMLLLSIRSCIINIYMGFVDSLRFFVFFYWSFFDIALPRSNSNLRIELTLDSYCNVAFQNFKLLSQ